MLCTKSNRIRNVTFLLIFGAFFACGVRASFAQEPPTVPLAGQLPPVGNAIPVGELVALPDAESIFPIFRQLLSKSDSKNIWDWVRYIAGNDRAMD